MPIGRSTYRVPVQVAVTTALAAGGLAPGAAISGSVPVDEIASGAVPPNGFVDFTIPAGTSLTITELGLDTPDAANTRFTTLVGAAIVPPFNAETGSPGPTAAPVAVPVPIPAGTASFTFRVADVGGVGFNVTARIRGSRLP